MNRHGAVVLFDPIPKDDPWNADPPCKDSLHVGITPAQASKLCNMAIEKQLTVESKKLMDQVERYIFNYCQTYRLGLPRMATCKFDNTIHPKIVEKVVNELKSRGWKASFDMGVFSISVEIPHDPGRYDDAE